jgi:hypothetical protein
MPEIRASPEALQAGGTVFWLEGQSTIISTKFLSHDRRRLSSEKSRRRWRPWLWTGLLLAFLLLFVPWALSPWATSAINRELAGLPGYTAHVRAVWIAPWKWAVDLEDFTLSDRGHEADGPLVKIGYGSMTLLPGALLRGRLMGHGTISDTELLIIQEEPRPDKNDTKEIKDTKAKERARKARQWQKELQGRFSLEISRFEITRAKIRFVDRSMPLHPEVKIEDFHLVATNLKTRADSADDLPARLEVTGRFSGGGTLRSSTQIAPLASPSRFKTSLEVKGLSLPSLHDFLQAYGNIDVKRGTFEVFVEAEARDGHYAGYVKPFLHDLEFRVVSDPEKSFVQNTATKVAGAVTVLLKNDEQKVATKAPFEGDFDQNQVDVWTTVENLLRNAFVQSLREGFEGRKPSG